MITISVPMMLQKTYKLTKMERFSTNLLIPRSTFTFLEAITKPMGRVIRLQIHRPMTNWVAIRAFRGNETVAQLMMLKSSLKKMALRANANTRAVPEFWKVFRINLAGRMKLKNITKIVTKILSNKANMN